MSVRALPSLVPAVLLCAALGPGCIVGGSTAGGPAGGAAADPVAAPGERDDRLFAELQRQQKWAEGTTASRASAEELKAAQQGDADAQADLRKRYRQLLRAAERATWIREATPVALAQSSQQEAPRLVAAFDRAAQLRAQAWDAADEIAEALCDTTAQSPLSLADLRHGLATVRAAEAAEARIARSPRATLLKAAPAPVPRPFIEATALLVDNHPAEEEGLRTFGAELSQDATRIRAALEDLRNRRPGDGEPGIGPTRGPATAAEAAAEHALRAEERKRAAPIPAAPLASEPPPPLDRTLSVAGDARDALKKRGAPQSITVVGDGTFLLRYEGAELAFAQDGTLLRETKRTPGAAPAPSAAPPPAPAPTPSPDPMPPAPPPQ